MRIAFLTLGCKVNSYETERMKLQFEEAGHDIVAFHEEADAYVVNTCTVTNIADRKSRKMLHRARRKNAQALVVAAGCYVDSAGRAGESDEGIDLLISNREKEQMVEKVEKAYQSRRGQAAEQAAAKGSISLMAKEEEHTRAYVKVQEGCNQYCSYCIIPYVRGALKSRAAEEVVAEVREIAARGVQEVVITGIHLSSYGADGGDAKSFVGKQGKPLLALLRQIHSVEGIRRIRLGSLEPRIITESFAEALASLPKVCPHFHLSLQSGCDATLKRMNRHYTTAEYLERVEILRRVYSDPAITTDCIVGFPQETEEEFAQTCAFVRETGFAQLHVFKYSRRRGTVADRMEGQVEERQKTERSEVLLQIAAERERAYQERFLGETVAVLLEEQTQILGKSYLVGYTERYVRVAVPAKEDSETPFCPNTIVSVRVIGHCAEGVLEAEWC